MTGAGRGPGLPQARAQGPVASDTVVTRPGHPNGSTIHQDLENLPRRKAAQRSTFKTIGEHQDFITLIQTVVLHRLSPASALKAITSSYGRLLLAYVLKPRSVGLFGNRTDKTAPCPPTDFTGYRELGAFLNARPAAQRANGKRRAGDCPLSKSDDSMRALASPQPSGRIDAILVQRMYRAHINLDYTGSVTNEYQRLISALVQAGWAYVETSALVIETHDLAAIWQGVEIVAKQSARAGTLSAFTLHIQGGPDFAGRPYPAEQNFPTAREDVLALPFPVPRPEE